MRNGVGNPSYWFEGYLKGNFSLKDDPTVALGGRDSFDPSKGYVGVRIQQGVPVLDRDWNELEDIRRYQEILLRRYLGDGTPDDGFKVTGTGGLGLSIGKGKFLVDGVEVVREDDITSNFGVWVSPDLTEIETTFTPTAAGDYYFYLEANFAQVTASEEDTLKNTEDWGKETCIRHVVSCRVIRNKNPGPIPAPVSAPPHWRSLLAIVKYDGTAITEIVDCRAKLHLLKTGDLGCQKVDGPLEIGNGAFLVGDLDKTLQVKFLDSAGTALTDPYFDLSPDRALLVGPVRIGDTTWPATPAQTEKLFVSGGATIGLTGNLGFSTSPNTIGLEVYDGAIIHGELTIANGGTLTLTGVTISGGTFSGAGSFNTGLLVNGGTTLTLNGGITPPSPATIGLAVYDGAAVNGGLTLNDNALTLKSGTLSATLSCGTFLGSYGIVNGNNGLFLPKTTGNSQPVVFEANDVTVSGVTSTGGIFFWEAEQQADALVPHEQDLVLHFKATNDAGGWSEIFKIKSDGSFSQITSDQKYKKNVATLDDVLQKMDQIRGVSFEWNDLYTVSHYGAPKTRQIGMIAQEVQTVFPELVESDKSREEIFLRLNYERFTAILVQAVKELKAMNEALSDRVKALEAPTKAKAKKVTDDEKPA